MPIPIKVASKFRMYQRSWNLDLERWKHRCKSAQSELREIQSRRNLVAHTGGNVHRPHSINSKASVPGSSVEEVGRQDILTARVAKCEETIRFLEKTIRSLKIASTSGVWYHGRFFIGLKKEPRFSSFPIARIPRGHSMTVLDIIGVWWRVRIASGAEGWVNAKEAEPLAPVDLSGLSSRPGEMGLPMSANKDIMAGRG